MPLSIHVEATIFAWIHISALWAFCLVLGSLIDSHWRLLKLVQVFILATVFWSVLIVLISLVLDPAQSSLLPQKVSHYLAGDVVSSKNFKINLAIWNVLFLPVLLASYTLYKEHVSHRSMSGRLKSFLKAPSSTPHITVAICICMVFVSLLLMLQPVLWFSAFSGYLLYRSSKPIGNQAGWFLNKKLFWSISCVCLLGLAVWIMLLPSLSLGPVAIAPIDASLWNFTWFGSGLGTHQDVVNVADITKESVRIVNWSPLAQIWSGFGSIGTLLFVMAILSIFYGAGDKKKVNTEDHICSSLYYAGFSSLCLLLIFGGLVSLWQWQSMTACIIYLVFFITWCRRLSQQTRSWVRWGLGVIMCSLLMVSTLLAGMTVGSKLVVVPWATLSLGSENDLHEGGQVETWLRSLSKTVPLGSEFFLSLGHRYLFQKRDEEAKEIIWSSLKMRPLSPEVHVAVASISACTGNEAAAMHFLSTNAARNYVPDTTTERLVTRLLGLPESSSAIKLINLALEHSPDMAKSYISLMRLYGYELQAIQGLLPMQPKIMLALGDLLVSEGDIEAAENVYWTAIYNKDKGLTRDEELYMRIAKHFAASNQLTEALIIVKEGRKAYPNSPDLQYLTSDLRERIGYEVD
jgi:hypothetical protein